MHLFKRHHIFLRAFVLWNWTVVHWSVFLLTSDVLRSNGSCFVSMVTKEGSHFMSGNKERKSFCYMAARNAAILFPCQQERQPLQGGSCTLDSSHFTASADYVQYSYVVLFCRLLVNYYNLCSVCMWNLRCCVSFLCLLNRAFIVIYSLRLPVLMLYFCHHHYHHQCYHHLCCVELCAQSSYIYHPGNSHSVIRALIGWCRSHG